VGGRVGSSGREAVTSAGVAAATRPRRLPNVLLCGTGEYTTGYVAGAASKSDKPMGVVALTMFDLRRRGLIGPKIGLCGRDGARAEGLRHHLASTIGATYSLDVSCNIWPSDPEFCDAKYYLYVLDTEYEAGDVAIITTPDDTHMEIALACITRGIHALIAKPIVQSLEEHWTLLRAASAYNASHPHSSPLIVAGEFHKRFDPLYADAVARIQSGKLGDLSYFHAYMSQPKTQLKTFEKWLLAAKKEEDDSKGGAGGDASSSTTTPGKRSAPSDISFYLNSHHLDLLHIATYRTSYPVSVQSIAATGWANSNMGQGQEAATSVNIEDTITIMVQYAHQPLPEGAIKAAIESESDTSSSSSTFTSSSTSVSASSTAATSFGIGIFTSSWIAPRSDVHSQQRFHFLGQRGEIQLDQAHRGYGLAIDIDNDESNGPTPPMGLQSPNPLFMRYQPNEDGHFCGQQAYGYKSFEHFIECCRGLPSTGIAPVAHAHSHAALFTTAVLEAAHRSRKEGNRKIQIEYDRWRRPIRVE